MRFNQEGENKTRIKAVCNLRCTVSFDLFRADLRCRGIAAESGMLALAPLGRVFRRKPFQEKRAARTLAGRCSAKAMQVIYKSFLA